MATKKYAFDMDFETEVVYFQIGTPEEDGSGPSAFQGLTLVEYRRFKRSKNWAFMYFDTEGNPNPGYMAKEISKEVYDLWKSRAEGAAKNPTTGYADQGGLWFPGNLPGSVLNEQAHNARMALLEESFYATDADKIIEAELLEVSRQQQLEAIKADLGLVTQTKAAVKPSKEALGLAVSRTGELRGKELNRTSKRELFNSIISTLKASRGAT